MTDGIGTCFGLAEHVDDDVDAAAIVEGAGNSGAALGARVPTVRVATPVCERWSRSQRTAEARRARIGSAFSSPVTFRA